MCKASTGADLGIIVRGGGGPIFRNILIDRQNQMFKKEEENRGDSISFYTANTSMIEI